jgi:hypothetical protein
MRNAEGLSLPSGATPAWAVSETFLSGILPLSTGTALYLNPTYFVARSSSEVLDS